MDVSQIRNSKQLLLTEEIPPPNGRAKWSPRLAHAPWRIWIEGAALRLPTEGHAGNDLSGEPSALCGEVAVRASSFPFGWTQD